MSPIVRFKKFFGQRVATPKPGFTLIEILIALVIFSLVMVISSGIFSTIIGNQGLISTNSQTSQEAQRIIRQISDDIVSADGVGVAHKPAGDVYTGIKGLLFFGQNDKIISADKICLAADIPDSNCFEAQTIVLFAKDNLKIYRFVPSIGNPLIGDIEYTSSPGTILKLNAAGDLDYSLSKLNNDKVEISAFKIWGAECYQGASCKNSPFAKINLEVRTVDYPAKAAGKRAKINLSTTVSGRSH